MFSRQQLKHAATLTEEDLKQISRCRRPYNRLGFAYQVAFMRLFNRFPRQQPFEIVEDLANLEQTTALKAQAAEFLKEQHILEPAEFRIIRIVGEQRARAREHIFKRIAAGVPKHLAVTLDDLLVVGPDENVSRFADN